MTQRLVDSSDGGGVMWRLDPGVFARDPGDRRLVRLRLLALALGVCLLAGAGGFLAAGHFRAQWVAGLAARMAADERYLMRELARVLGPARAASGPSGLVEPRPACGSDARRVVRRELVYSGTSDSGLVQGTVRTLSRLGYRGAVTATVRSGQASYGTAVNGDDRVFGFAAADGRRGRARYLVYGFVNCSRLGPTSAYQL